MGTDSVPTKANYSAIFVKFPAQTADLTLLWEDFSNLNVGFVSSSRRIPKICLLALSPALMGFSSLFADLPAVEQYCSGLRRKVGEFCIILSHLPSLLQTLSYFYLSPQMLTRLAFFILRDI